MWDHTSNNNINMYINKFRLRVELARAVLEEYTIKSLSL